MNEINGWPWVECRWCGDHWQVPVGYDTNGYCSDECEEAAPTTATHDKPDLGVINAEVGQ